MRSPKLIFKKFVELYCVKARIFITFESIGITVRRPRRDRKGHQLPAAGDQCRREREREREEGSESRLNWFEQGQLEREAERVTAGFVEAIFLRAAVRIEAMKAERQELALMRERAAEAAMRRLHDPIVINDHDDVLSVGDAEREVDQAEALDCASVEESRRAEDELEHYLLNDSDDEHMEVEARATNRGPSPHDACVAPGSPLLPEEEAAGPASLDDLPPALEAREEPPRPQRVWPYEDENWDSDAEMDEPQEQRAVPLEQRRGDAPPRMSRTQRRRARRYNPNRQPTMDDYVSRRPSPPLEEHPGAPCRRERSPLRPRQRLAIDACPPAREEERTSRREDVHAQLGAAPTVRRNGVMFGGLRAIPTDPAVDPPAYHCFNCWQHGHDSAQCARPRVRAYCNNCGRHGVDLRDCPRCSEAHQRFVQTSPKSGTWRRKWRAETAKRCVSRRSGAWPSSRSN